MNILERAKVAVIKVGEGRGFVARRSTQGDPFIVTAAHCLPRLPGPHLGRRAEEETFKNLIGILGCEPTVWATLTYCDPMSDIAILDGPDNQTLNKQYDAYQAFTNGVGGLPIGPLPPPIQIWKWEEEPQTEAWMMSLSGEWQKCTVQNDGRFLSVCEDSNLIEGGMSGSPILDAYGAAIGIISTGSDGGEPWGNRNPAIMECLPRFALRTISTRRSRHHRIHSLL